MRGKGFCVVSQAPTASLIALITLRDGAQPSDSMLHLAARAWAPGSVRFLLDKGADLAYINQV